MAVVDTGGGAANNSSNIAVYASASFTPAAGDRLLVMGGISDTALDIAITDSQGLGWTVLAAEQSGILSGVVGISNATAAAVAMTTSFDVTGDNGTGCHMTNRRLTNVRATAPFHRQIAFASGGAGTTPTVVMPMAFNTNNAGFGLVLNLTSPAGVTEPSGWGEPLDLGHATPDMGMEYVRRLSGETASTITWGSTSATAWLAFVVEIYEVNQPTGIIPRIMHHRNQMGSA